ncbi:MAG TPA: DUF2846 domain-containing protein [Verrucomicrobiae bacterium]|nr:DUF2846 domain-containing protein [Verrucomicrobiae bacterium]
MNSKLVRRLAPLALVLCVGCASSSQFAPIPDMTKKIDDPQKARIYVLRPSSYGMTFKMRVYDGDKKVGLTSGESYLCWERDPGVTEVRDNSDNKAHVEIDAEAGHVYYILEKLSAGWVNFRSQLNELSEEDGLHDLRKCAPPKPRESKE